MKFVLSSDLGTYVCPVVLSKPSGAGKRDRQTISLEFKILGQSRMDEIAELSSKGKVTDQQFAEEVVVGWEDVVLADGSDAEFSLPAFQELLEIPLAARAIVKSYYDNLEEKGKRGN